MPGGVRSNKDKRMELFIFFAVLTTLVALADRFGVDSRDGLRSHEAELAALGFSREQRTWSGNSSIGTSSEKGT